jgi:hypothetical protein
MDQRDAAVDLVAGRLAARGLQVRLPDVPEIGSLLSVVVSVVRMRLCEQRERSGKNEREKDAQGGPPDFEGESNAFSNGSAADETNRARTPLPLEGSGDVG